MTNKFVRSNKTLENLGKKLKTLIPKKHLKTHSWQNFQ
jgi:hypothetical protein